jgi:hypothetical protein
MTAAEGRCHCGAIRFTARLDPPLETSRCNRSICLPTRFRKAVVPAGDFSLDASDGLRTHRFGTGAIEHAFCGACGVKTHGRGEVEGFGPFVAINVACLGLAPDVPAGLPVELQEGAHDAWDRVPDVTKHP